MRIRITEGRGSGGVSVALRIVGGRHRVRAPAPAAYRRRPRASRSARRPTARHVPPDGEDRCVCRAAMPTCSASTCATIATSASAAGRPVPDTPHDQTLHPRLAGRALLPERAASHTAHMIDHFCHVADALDLRKEPRDIGLRRLATEVHHALAYGDRHGGPRTIPAPTPGAMLRQTTVSGACAAPQAASLSAARWASSGEGHRHTRAALRAGLRPTVGAVLRRPGRRGERLWRSRNSRLAAAPQRMAGARHLVLSSASQAG